MSEATDRLLLELQRNAAPPGGWTMPVLRRLTGLTVGPFAAAVAALRADGKLHPFDLALASASAHEQAEPVVEPVAKDKPAAPSAQDVALGALLQERALDGAPLLAAGIIRDRWAPTWERVCDHARATGQRPVMAMIALLDGALEKDAVL
jgi:hypothetical protein